MPVAEVDVDADLVARLVVEQHPDLAGPLTLANSGWDNVIYRLGGELCVRLPRRRVAVDLIHHEQRWLPTLARQVGVDIPAPVRVGRPGAGFPWPWSITRWYDGQVAAEREAADRTALAVDLADFLHRLHTPAPADAPPNPVRGVPLPTRDAVVRERLATGLIPAADRLAALWETLSATPAWSSPPVWLHGDPHPANLLLDPGTGRLRAVLDFGDITSGDPACDLAAGWLVFDAVGRRTFRTRLDRHGDLDPATWQRARGWALVLGTAFAAHSADNPAMAAIGRHTLAQVLLPDSS